MTPLDLRVEARAILQLSLADTFRALTVETARLKHGDALIMCDGEAIALWARVVWRLLSGERRHEWLLQPVGYVGHYTGSEIRTMRSMPRIGAPQTPPPPPRRDLEVSRAAGQLGGRRTRENRALARFRKFPR
jgi:hypothetical protein